MTKEVEANASGRRWRWGALALVAILAALGWWRARGGDPAAVPGATASAVAGGKGMRGGAGAGRAIPVQVGQVSQGPVQVYLGALGTVTPASSVVLRSRVDGPLLQLAVHEGELVKAGQLIAQIDPRSFQVQVEQAEGQLAKDQAQLNSARQQLVRYQSLLAQDSISRQQVETQDALVKQYEGSVKADQAALSNAKLQLSYCRIAAPVSGRLGLRQVDPGNMIHASDANGLFVINQVQPIDAAFTLPEGQLPKLMTHGQAHPDLVVQAWDREQKKLLGSGKVLSFDNQIDASTGTIKIKARFANDDLALFPNQFVNIKLLAHTLENATLVPSAAVQRGRDGAFVYVVGADRKVAQRKLKLSVDNGAQIVVEEGLQPGEQVVVDGIDQLRDGALIEIADAGSLLKQGRTHGAGRRGDAAASAPAADASAPWGGHRRRSAQSAE